MASFSGVSDACRLAYLAGIVDGEGCLGIIKKSSGNYSPYISVGMVEMAIPNLLRNEFGGNVYIDSHGRYRNIYRWQTRKFDVIHDAIEALLPYLIIKKPQAYVLKEFIDGIPSGIERRTSEEEISRRLQLYLRNKKLNLVGAEHPEAKA